MAPHRAVSGPRRWPPVMGNLFLSLLPEQWRGVATAGPMKVQIIRRSITAAEPGWLRVQAWRYVGGPAPELVTLEVRAEVLPPDARPGGAR